MFGLETASYRNVLLPVDFRSQSHKAAVSARGAKWNTPGRGAEKKEADGGRERSAERRKRHRKDPRRLSVAVRTQKRAAKRPPSR